MRYTALSDQQIEALKPSLEDGIYKFKVTEAKDESMPDGKEQIAFSITIIDQNQNKYILKEWFNDNEKFIWKIKHFWESVGYPEIYAQGDFKSHDIIGKEGLVETKKRKEKNGFRMFPKIYDYIKTESSNDKLIEDSLPF